MSGAEASRIIDQRSSDWNDMAKVDMGTSVNPVVREMNDLISTMQSDFGDGFNRARFEFDNNGSLIGYLNGYQTNTGDYNNTHINQTLDMHSVTMNRQGLADFLSYLDRGPFNGYADFARQEMQSARRKGGRRR